MPEGRKSVATYPHPVRPTNIMRNVLKGAWEAKRWRRVPGLPCISVSDFRRRPAFRVSYRRHQQRLHHPARAHSPDSRRNCSAEQNRGVIGEEVAPEKPIVRSGDFLVRRFEALLFEKRVKRLRALARHIGRAGARPVELDAAGLYGSQLLLVGLV